MMIHDLKVGDRFRHFRSGAFYVVTNLFIWESTKEPAVCYENEQTKEVWGRPVAVFLEEVAHEGATVPRFAKINGDAQEISLYGIIEKLDRHGLPFWEVMHWGSDQPIATLAGGNAAVIVLSFANMSRQGQRGNDYLAGALAGMIHLQLLHGLPPARHP